MQMYYMLENLLVNMDYTMQYMLTLFVNITAKSLKTFFLTLQVSIYLLLFTNLVLTVTSQTILKINHVYKQFLTVVREY